MAKRNKLDAYYDEDDESKIVPDGFGVSVRMEMMDGKMRKVTSIVDANAHRPHFAVPTELENFRRNFARDEMIKNTCNAWRTTARDQAQEEYKPDDPPDPDDDVDDNQRRRQARDTYLKNLKNAWRTPVGPRPGVPGPAPENYVGSGSDSAPRGRPMLSRDAAADLRNRSYAEYVHRTTNAWKTPR